jgi:hypothetical protein
VGFFGDLLKGATGAIGGFLTGGPVGAIAGGLGGLGVFGGGQTGSQAAKNQARAQGMGVPGTQAGMPTLPQVSPRIGTQGIQATPRGREIRINPPFGGAPGVGISIQETGGNGRAGPSVAGRIGGRSLPFMGDIGVSPAVFQRQVRVCPRGQRLAIDGLCYPKALLGKRSPFRAWPSDPAPPVTAADAKALRKVDSIRKKVRTLGTKADLKVTRR